MMMRSSQRGSHAQSRGCNLKNNPGFSPRNQLLKTATASQDQMSLQRYGDRLVGAEQAMDARFAANACPRENLASFKNLGLLGAGSYGDVHLVEYSKDRKKYALKVQLKSQYEEAFEREGVIREKKLQYAMRDVFVVRVFFAFQDDVNLYLVMECAELGDCSRFKGQCLPESVVKLFAAQLILAIEYIHACNIIHRDIKPANVMIFADSYLKLGDFGVSKKVVEWTSTFVGPPAYMAPEIIRREHYGKAVDWWGVGIFIFELRFGKHPFCCPDWERMRMTDAIVSKEVSFPGSDDSDSSFQPFVLALLEKNQCKRLGALEGGVDDIRQHEWFRNISFVDVFNKRIPIPLNLAPVGPKPNTSGEWEETEPCNHLKDSFAEF